MRILLSVSPEELKEIEKVIDQMNKQAKEERKLPLFQASTIVEGSVNIKINENRGSEALEHLFMLLRGLERFQRPSWP
jgi:hypothetical protein